jgi:hypothetical protein
MLPGIAVVLISPEMVQGKEPFFLYHLQQHRNSLKEVN